MTSRGIRNNNPGNIDRNATKWQGMADDQSGDPRFVVFTAPEYGIRAIAKLMMTYQTQYGLKTVRGLIGRWAPPGENNTGAYVAAVAAAMEVGPDDEIDVDSAAIMLPLVKAIILHENGQNPYSDATIAEGIRRAGVVDAPKPALHKDTAFVAKAAAMATGGVGACADFCKGLITDPTKAHDLADKAKDAASQFDGLGPIFDHAKTALLTAAGGLLAFSMVSSFLKQRAS